MSSPAIEKPNRLKVWGHSMVGKLKAISRKRRKREASKKRRLIERTKVRELADEAGL